MADCPEKRRRVEPQIDFSLCPKCQSGGGELIACPKETCLTKLVECVRNRGTYGDKSFPESSKTKDELT